MGRSEHGGRSEFETRQKIRSIEMGNDKAFGIWVILLISGISTVVTTQVLAGTAMLPSIAVFVEHVVLGLLIRGAYHSFDGPYHIFSAEPETVEATASAGAAADAVS
jgi:hypothetical protein